jgi:uncharacterized protein involved in response to NO
MFKSKFVSEPYRLFFPLGIFYLLWGSLIWLPMLWNPSQYPVQAHRFLMLNGFSASFIAGFLMTAVPKFSKTESAKFYEVLFFFLATVFGLAGAFLQLEKFAYLFSAMQAFLILSFLLMRVFHRKENPPYSFVFIFVGLILWLISAMVSSFNPTIAYKSLHYEGAISAIILGVGSRLIPGIMGHVEVVQTQRSHYENSKPFLLTVPLHFYAMIGLFLGSYFFSDMPGLAVRAFIVGGIALYYWQLYKAPKEKTSLTWCIWISCWLIVASFILKVLWYNGAIHASHAFFLSGIVLLSLLIATRVLQSHGPQKKSLENLKRLYVVTGLVILAGATRVSAFLMPAYYLKHLGYSSIVLSAAVLLWSVKYLPFIFVSNGNGGKK